MCTSFFEISYYAIVNRNAEGQELYVLLLSKIISLHFQLGILRFSVLFLYVKDTLKKSPKFVTSPLHCRSTIKESMVWFGKWLPKLYHLLKFLKVLRKSKWLVDKNLERNTLHTKISGHVLKHSHWQKPKTFPHKKLKSENWYNMGNCPIYKSQIISLMCALVTKG
jgi:hypothetical protein